MGDKNLPGLVFRGTDEDGGTDGDLVISETSIEYQDEYPMKYEQLK